MEGKQCSTCRQTKPLHDFGNSKRSKDGHVARCLECSRQANKDYWKRKQAGNVQPRKAKLLDANGLKECFNCGERKPADQYNKQSQSKDGLQSRCRPCENTARSAYYRKKTAGKVNRKPLRTFSEDGTQRWCNRCQAMVDVGKFGKNKNGQRGLASTCRDCVKIQKRKQYLKKSEGKVTRRRRSIKSEDGTKKTCLDCNKMLPLTEYHPNNAAVDGVGSLCRECTRISNHKAYWKDPERAKQRVAQARATNPEQTKATRLDWYYRNREHAAEVHKQWQQDNPHKRIEYHSRRRARQAAAVPQRWKREECPDHLCYWCGRITFTWVKPSDPRKRVLEHLMPISLGGPAEPENEAQACHQCNQAKSDKHPLVWLAQIVTDVRGPQPHPIED